MDKLDDIFQEKNKKIKSMQGKGPAEKKEDQVIRPYSSTCMMDLIRRGRMDGKTSIQHTQAVQEWVVQTNAKGGKGERDGRSRSTL